MNPKYPRCEGKTNDGQCRSVVLSLTSDNELERRFCRYHADRFTATFPPPPDEPAEDVGRDDRHVVDETLVAVVPDADADRALSSFPAPLPAQRRGLPRAEIRDLAESSVAELRQFFADALSAKRRARAECPKCKKVLYVDVPDWAARTRVVQLMFEQGYGRPELAETRDEDALIEAAVDRAMSKLLTGERLARIAGVDEDEAA